MKVFPENVWPVTILWMDIILISIVLKFWTPKETIIKERWREMLHIYMNRTVNVKTDRAKLSVQYKDRTNFLPT